MKFEYRAIKDNQIIKGEIDAKTQSKAVEVLKSNRITLLDVKEKTGFGFNFDLIFNRVSFNEIVNLTRHLAIMLNAGLTITDAIDILKKQTEKKGMTKLINSIDEE